MKKIFALLTVLLALSSIAYASETFGEVSTIASTTTTPTSEPTPTASSGSSGGGGGGGGGSSRGYSFSSNYNKDTIEAGESVYFNLTTGLRYSFRVNNADHSVYLSEKHADSVKIVVRSVAQNIELNVGESIDVDLDQNGKNDVKIKLLGMGNYDAKFMMTRLGAPIEQVATPYTAIPTPAYTEPAEEPVEYTPEPVYAPIGEVQPENVTPFWGPSMWWLSLFFILAIIAVAIVWYYHAKYMHKDTL